MHIARFTSRTQSHRWFLLPAVFFWLLSSISTAQTIYVPGGTVGISSNSNVGIGTSTPGAFLEIADAPGTYPSGVIKAVSVTSTGAGDSGGTTDIRGVDLTVTATGAASMAAVMGVYANIKLNGTAGTVANAVGTLSLAEQTGSSAISFLSGAWGKVNTTGSGTVTNAYGVQAFLTQNGTGNVTNWTGFLMTAITASSSGDVTGAINAFKANAWGRATATTAYGFNAGDATKGSGVLAGFRGGVGAAPGKYNLYMDGTAQNYLAGNVGIGTTDPGTYKLAVNGTIRAKEVIVDTGWSDYVFDEDYRLAPLSEVESHILSHKRLPGIPSAAEVAEHGVSMGDMQARLLAKVEELTLHLIAQEKHLHEQTERITALEQENLRLRSR